MEARQHPLVVYSHTQRRDIHRLFNGCHFGRWLMNHLPTLNPVNETTPPIVGEHVMDITFPDTLLMLLPEFGLKQISMVLHEDFAHPQITQQEGAEGFREHVARSD